jgi:nitrile hydratase accessory protein
MTDDGAADDQEGEAETDAPDADVDDLLGYLPIDAEDPTFEAPWQARAFAVAVVLSDRYEGVYSWTEFQENLIGEVQSAAGEEGIEGSEAAYYEQWLRALERLVVEEELVDRDAVRRRVAAFADGDRDASEFVEGEHDHSHGESPTHAHDHDHPRDR